MLEPYVVKVTSTVLRRESGGNTADLADNCSYAPFGNPLACGGFLSLSGDFAKGRYAYEKRTAHEQCSNFIV